MDAPAQQPSIGSELGAATGVPSVPKHADVGSVSGDGIGSAAGSSEPAQPVQAAVSKPVFKMKRTGQGSLPPTTPTPDVLSLPPATPASKDTAAEPEPAMIVSDILPTQAPSTPAVDSRSELPRVSSEPDSARKTKYATDEERRRATSLALKQRWASGLMDHVAKKRAETMKRRRTEALDPIGTPGITKPSGPVGSARHAQMSPAYPGRLTISSPAGLTASPTHHGRKQSLVSEQLARLFEDKPASAGPNVQAKADEGKPGIPGLSGPRTVDSRTPGAPGVSSPSRSPFSAGQAESVPGVGLNVADESEAHSEWQEEESLPDSLDDGARSGEPDGGETDAEGANSHAKDVPAQLEMAVPGRPYTKWWDSKGALLPAYGALLPEGYQLSYTTPGHPWVCPIRSCRTVFSKIAQLGYHFNRRHRGVMLHDNQDGTFSERGMYAPRSRQRGDKAAAAAPAIVVSKGGAEPGDPPAVAPRYPNLRLEDRADSGTNGANSENGTGTSATPMGHSRPEHTEAPENGVGNDGLEEVGGDTNAGDDVSMEDLVDESTAGTTLQAGGAPAGITEAEPGRPYTMWPGKAPLLGA
ncbi:6388f316-e7a7-4334-b022-fe26e4a5868e [Thermothielavioides terrestris]|uniref:6388f316-e7a7-4334-b022-fe26e4a5868e n=1 Tax=Thermothielavioides terrestris TaxID=2587410 RepID=A0A3S4BP61_9PEZI|nr:6388f316-e7a7-4334-b022-fe26e4a5868e [Thermothielavioides terrestris]